MRQPRRLAGRCSRPATSSPRPSSSQGPPHSGQAPPGTTCYPCLDLLFTVALAAKFPQGKKERERGAQRLEAMAATCSFSSIARAPLSRRGLAGARRAVRLQIQARPVDQREAPKGAHVSPHG